MRRRIRKQFGSVVFDKRIRTWHFIWWKEGRRHSKVIGSIQHFPTRASAWKAAKPLVSAMENPVEQDTRPIAVDRLVELYRAEKMPRRQSTRRGYESWLKNHILPRWGESPLIAVQARPVELWLQALSISPKSKVHIRGVLSILWDYAMWRADVPTQRNPMELVSIKGSTKRVRKPISLTVEQFQTLLEALRDDVCLHTMVLVAVSFGLRISEVLGLKWDDIDWLRKAVRIERGVVKQIVDYVKSDYSARTMVIADGLLDVLKQWRQTTQFSAPEDWIFSSPAKFGRQPLSYSHVWSTLSAAAKNAGIGHVSSHAFRHTHRTWLDSVGTPVGVQQKLMRHADIRTTMNIYGDAVTEDMRNAHEKVVRLALPRT
jgi:integrase